MLIIGWYSIGFEVFLQRVISGLSTDTAGPWRLHFTHPGQLDSELLRRAADPECKRCSPIIDRLSIIEKIPAACPVLLTFHWKTYWLFF
jgi:hypothetical protein